MFLFLLIYNLTHCIPKVDLTSEFEVFTQGCSQYQTNQAVVVALGAKDALKIAVLDYNNRVSGKTKNAFEDSFIWFIIASVAIREDVIAKSNFGEFAMGINTNGFQISDIKERSGATLWLIALDSVFAKCIKEIYPKFVLNSNMSYNILYFNKTLKKRLHEAHFNICFLLKRTNDMPKGKLSVFARVSQVYASLEHCPIVSSCDNSMPVVVMMNEQLQKRSGFFIKKKHFPARVEDAMHEFVLQVSIYCGQDATDPFSNIALALGISFDNQFDFEYKDKKNVDNEEGFIVNTAFMPFPYTALEYQIFEQELIEFTQRAMIEAAIQPVKDQPVKEKKNKKVREPKFHEASHEAFISNSIIINVAEESEASAEMIEEKLAVIDFEPFTQELNDYQRRVIREQNERARMVVSGKHYAPIDKKQSSKKKAAIALSADLPTDLVTEADDIAQEEFDQSKIEQKRVRYRQLLQMINQACDFDHDVHLVKNGSHFTLHGLPAGVVKFWKFHGRQDDTIPGWMALDLLNQLIQYKRALTSE